MSAIDDALDDALDLERIAFNEGFREGAERGRVDGIDHGRELGFQKGFELAREVGYYAGCARVWRELMARVRDESVYSERVRRLVAQFDALVAASAIGDPLDAEVLARAEALRGKFKTIVALLGAREAYGDGANDDRGISF